MHGDIIESGVAPFAGAFHHQKSWKLLDDATGVTDGQWVDFRGYMRGSLEVLATAGTFSATVQLRGSNAPTMPDNTNHGQQIGADISAEGLVFLNAPVRWVKTRIPIHGSGTIAARLHVLSPS